MPTTPIQLLGDALEALNATPRFPVAETDSYHIAANITHFLANPQAEPIWVLKIDHKHDSYLSLHRSEERAWEEIYLYVADQWDDGLTDQYGHIHHLTRQEAIEAYYDAHASAFDPEIYTLDLVYLR